MKTKPLFFSLFVLFALNQLAYAGLDARMMRYPDVSETQITFVYAGDIWLAPIAGGMATRLSSPAGEEAYPRFSPDGKLIAFTGNYSGNMDVYQMPVTGGMPSRLTWHGQTDRIIDWKPDGSEILFASARYSGRQRFNQFYTLNTGLGLPEKLPMAYAEYGSYSPDGEKIAFTDKSRLGRTWKRYRGGTAADIFIYDLNNGIAERIISGEANHEMPMWSGNAIYYMSDRGAEKRYNLWKYDIETKENSQLTNFTDFDIHHPAIGPNHIVFEAGGSLYLFSLQNEKASEVQINVITDQITVAPEVAKAKNYIQHWGISAEGNRVLAEARGDIFSLPAEKGVIKNLTQSSGTAQRYPTWSPDGTKIAFWSDEPGEYALFVYHVEQRSTEQIINPGPGYRYHLYWSPDNKKIAWIDQSMKIQYYDFQEDKITGVDQGLSMFHGPLENFSVSWSSDSRWITYDRGTDAFNAIFLFDTKEKARHQVTTGYYHNYSPSFDPAGNYLFLLTNRYMHPSYSEMDNSFIYDHSTKIAAIPLRKNVASLLTPQNDSVTIIADEKPTEEEKNTDKEENDDQVSIDLAGFEERMVLLDIPNGKYRKLHAIEGKLIYQATEGSGSAAKRPLKIYDLKEKETTDILGDVDAFFVSQNGKKILAVNKNIPSVIDAAASQKMDKTVPVNDMEMVVDLKAEWQQLFNEAWRLERDYFYDENMHGVDWEAMKEQYGALIDQCLTRWDVNFVLGELIGELNASHTYKGGGDTEKATSRNVGYLGVDWEIAYGYYTIKDIIKGAIWDAETKSPLSDPSLNISSGMYILEVNGIPLDITREPYAAFEGLAGKTVELLVNTSPKKEGARTVAVKTLSSETRLRHLAWIENKRKRVEEATQGKAGYIYVRSTGIDGQNELVRQFYAQYAKDALIVDERFNSGGQIPDRFIELLNRKPLAYWAVRDGKDWQWPPVANFGPKIMLINGWSGSGGDAFPDYFRKSGLGPLLGSTTWGGLIGISGVPQLIDGGVVTVPTFRMYNPDGGWFREGLGVDPDIEVPEDHTSLSKNIDNQLEEAIEWINNELKSGKAWVKPERPADEKR